MTTTMKQTTPSQFEMKQRNPIIQDNYMLQT